MLIEGEVGIGKTTLLNWGRAAGADRGFRVLSASPVEVEVPWEFAALADLLEPVPRSLIGELPESQRRAIGVAVFRDEPPDVPVDPRTLATAVLRVLRALAAEGPVVLAVDDLPLLDLPSARVLSYVLRRAREAPIGLLGAVRLDWSSAPRPVVTDAVEPDRVERVTVGPLGVRAMRAVLAERAGITLGRAALRRVHELSQGNPLFALELVAENAVDLTAEFSPALDVPESLRRLVRRRVGPLSPGALDVLLVAALSGEPTHAVVSAAAADPTSAHLHLERMVEAGIVRKHADRLTFAHPLIRSVVASEAGVERRRAAHCRLASAVRHREVRARHLALGIPGPYEAVARAVEEAALSAAGRGACETAATLAELAVSLTPLERTEERNRRIAIEAENRFEASEPARSCSLLAPVIEELAPGPGRAELRRRMARYSAYRGVTPEWLTVLDDALEECGDDLALQRSIALDLAVAASNFGDEEAARRYTQRAFELVAGSGDLAQEAQLSAGMAFVRFSRGEGLHPDLIERGLVDTEQPSRLSMELRPRVVIGHLRHLSDDLDGARPLYGAEHALASAQGVETELPLLLWGLVETEAWAGRWGRAEELAALGSELADDAGASPPVALMAAVRGLLHVYRGRTEEGVRDGELAVATAIGMNWPLAALVGAQALGLAGLSVGDAAATHERLAPVMGVVRAVGILEPGFLHFLPDEIEALIRLGELDQADELLGAFATRSAELGRIFGLATSSRCRGLLLAARGDLEGASLAVDTALAHHDRLPMPFERGRTLLVAGEIARRANRRQRAREDLVGAAAIFADLGAPTWEQRTREEARRLGLRAGQLQATGTELTEAERRVADLVVAGHSNAEVAIRLFISRRTAENHLQRVYHKLGVRSRTELSRVYPPSP